MTAPTHRAVSAQSQSAGLQMMLVSPNSVSETPGRRAHGWWQTEGYSLSRGLDYWGRATAPVVGAASALGILSSVKQVRV